MKRLSGWLLSKFNDWFTSAAGVWHTFILVMAIVVAEVIHLVNDNHGFWLLYWLTVYSAVTQPALAFVARAAGDKQGEMLTQIKRLEEQNSELLNHMEALRGEGVNE